MNKKLLSFILVIIIIVSFSMGAFAAETSVLQTVKLKLMSDIRASSSTKVEGIEADVRAVVEEKLNQKSIVELGRATNEVQAYLDAKVQAIGDSTEVATAVADLETITDIMIQEGKDQIDVAISNVFAVN